MVELFIQDLKYSAYLEVENTKTVFKKNMLSYLKQSVILLKFQKVKLLCGMNCMFYAKLGRSTLNRDGQTGGVKT